MVVCSFAASPTGASAASLGAGLRCGGGEEAAGATATRAASGSSPAGSGATGALAPATMREARGGRPVAAVEESERAATPGLGGAVRAACSSERAGTPQTSKSRSPPAQTRALRRQQMIAMRRSSAVSSILRPSSAAPDREPFADGRTLPAGSPARQRSGPQPRSAGQYRQNGLNGFCGKDGGEVQRSTGSLPVRP
jgi:hypothetical protein